MKTKLGAWARRCIALLLVVPLSGCWLQLGGNAANTNFNSSETGLTLENVGSLHEIWSDPATPGNKYLSEPIVSGGRIFTTRYDTDADTATVVARSLSTGAVLWERPLGQVPDYTTPAVVYINDALWQAYTPSGSTTCTSTLERLDPATGAVLSTEQTEVITSAFTAEGPTVAHLGSDGCSTTTKLVVRDVVSRAVVWSHVFSTAGGHQPTIGHGKVFVNITGQELQAFPTAGCGAATCEPLWTTPSSGSPNFRGRPVAGPGGHVLIETATSVLPTAMSAYSAADGSYQWASGDPNPIGGSYVAGFAASGDKVYVNMNHVSEPEVQTRVHSATGQWLWNVPFTGIFGWVRPTIGGDVVYLPRGNSVVAVPAEGCGTSTCDVVKTHTFSDLSVESLSLAGGRLVVRSGDRLAVLGP